MEHSRGIDMCEKVDILGLFASLPHLTHNYEIVEDWNYTPSLYHFDSQWFVSWVHCEEGDTLLDYFAETPEEAILKARSNYEIDIASRKQNLVKHKEE